MMIRVPLEMGQETFAITVSLFQLCDGRTGS